MTGIQTYEVAMAKTGRQSFQFMLRLPDDLRDRLRDLATMNRRSLNAEIVTRLEESLAPRFERIEETFEDVDGNVYVKTDPDLAQNVGVENAIISVRMALEDLEEIIRRSRKRSDSSGEM